LYHESEVGDVTDSDGATQFGLTERYSSAYAVMEIVGQVPPAQLVSETLVAYELVSLSLRVPFPVALPELMV